MPRGGSPEAGPDLLAEQPLLVTAVLRSRRRGFRRDLHHPPPKEGASLSPWSRLGLRRMVWARCKGHLEQGVSLIPGGRAEKRAKAWLKVLLDVFFDGENSRLD